MTARVGVVDYGRGNLHSIVNALKFIGAAVEVVTSDGPHDLQLLVIPGVGAFSEGMHGLRTRGLDDFIWRFAAAGRPVLGICLGSQLLMSSSEEFGEAQGLGLIEGRVAGIPPSDEAVPHVGWKQLQDVAFTGDGPFPSVADGVWAYFVHSYHCVPATVAHVAAQVSHGGQPITAVVAKDNVVGFQFHPEKSGSPGLRMLDDFLKLA